MIQLTATSNISGSATQIGAWNDVICRVFENLTVDTDDDGFEGALEMRRVGGLEMARVASSPAVVRRAKPGCGVSDRYFKLHIQDRGSSLNHQEGREAILGRGDIMLCDSSRPYSIRFDDPNRMLVVRLPEDRLITRLDDPDAVVGQRIGMEGLGASMLASFVQNLWRAGEAEVERDADADFVDVVLDLMAIAYDRRAPCRDTGATSLKERIRRFVDKNLCDPELSVGVVARGVGVTPRYVQMVFASMGMTPMAYIRDKRLQLAAQRLRRGGADCCITDLAFDLGFNDLSHFSRTFKSRYGVGPRDYRTR